MSLNSKPDSDKLLYKLILQFAIFSRGTSEQLDPHLNNITQQLKQGINYHKLLPELTALSKTLVHISKTETSTVKQSSHTQQLSSSDPDQHTYFISQLMKLLHETEIPFEFNAQCKQLIKKTRGDMSSNRYKEIIDMSMNLLLNIQGQSSTEQDIIESFLANISSQLGSLDELASDISSTNEQAIDSREQLNNVIDLQVDNIKNSTAKAEELSSLQQLINQHLQDLSVQRKEHQKTEDNRQLESQKQLEQMSKKLHEMEAEADSLRTNLKVAHDKALRDALTGLPNRLAYDERISLEYKYWQRYKTPLSLVIWDIDFFKKINDTFGHKAGDKTLALVSRLLSSNCRETDFISRFGGEEFVMLLPNTPSSPALAVAEKIRAVIERTSFNHNGQLIQLTISCGISEYINDDEHETVFERADKALYLSKEQGRNKCSVINE